MADPNALRDENASSYPAQRAATHEMYYSRDRAGRGKRKGCRTRIGGSSGSSLPSDEPVAAKLHPYSRAPEPVHKKLLLFFVVPLTVIGGTELGVR